MHIAYLCILSTRSYRILPTYIHMFYIFMKFLQKFISYIHETSMHVQNSNAHVSLSPQKYFTLKWKFFSINFYYSIILNNYETKIRTHEQDENLTT